MATFFNSLPSRQYVIIGDPECGYIGYGWPTPRCRRRCYGRGYRYNCRYPDYRESCAPALWPGLPFPYSCHPYFGGYFPTIPY